MTLSELVHSVFDDVQERANGEVYVDCCFCDDGKHRLGINVETGVLHCFKCEAKSGDKRSTVKSKRRTFEKIAAETNYPATFSLDEGEVDTSVEEKVEQLKKDVPKVELKLPKAYEPLWTQVNDSVGKQALKYIKDRGITDEQIKKHRIGFAAVGRYAYRIIFPVYYGNKLSGFVCRDFTGNAELKYLNSDGEKGIYGLRIKKKRRRAAILVEGTFDKLAVERAKLNYDVLGALGSKLTPGQLKKLNTYNTIVVWAEPDRAGVEGTIKRAKQLQKKKTKVLVVLPDEDPDTDTDPGAMNTLEIKERVENAKSYTSGIAAIMRNRVALTSPVKKKKKFVKKGNKDG